MKNFRIYSEPKRYKLKLYIDNYKDDIKVNFNVTITVNKCSDDQLKMSKNSAFYCVIPHCKASCPVSNSASCKPYTDEIVETNDANLNNCHCNNGWFGENCDKKIYINYSIIEDTGFYKNIFFSIGMLLYAISNIFSAYTSYTQWVGQKNNENTNNKLKFRMGNSSEDVLATSGCSPSPGSFNKSKSVKSTLNIKHEISGLSQKVEEISDNIIISKRNVEIEEFQDKGGLWYYQYNLEKENLVFNSIEFCYMDGDNPVNYFIFRLHSTTCECNLNMTKDVFLSQVRKVLDLYDVCSTFFERVDHKIVYVSTRNKIDYLTNN
ncbi:hypothetical protein PIROE2DRAFT_14062 [Piromyces sp. E2]|nr:hypothetical protein PIROE2DRAFT_14062 [Piromyces sp. E2]|eukprot:OUM60244.1 hypothetical protein PIROE2DRAFT_14062 [Piromyces sp. E2]